MFAGSLIGENENHLLPGNVFQDCSECPEMVVIPKGVFQMGSTKNPAMKNQEVAQSEQPVHSVVFEYTFAIGKYPITFTEWDACVEDGGCDGYRPDHKGWRGQNEPGWSRGQHPVFRVNYFDTQSYLKWINSKTGGGYRLLSEAEWEYAARAGTTTEYNTGDTLTQADAKFHDGETHFPTRKGNWKVKTVPVGLYAPNAFGVYDIHGGIAERLIDCWHPSYVGAPTDGSAWIADGDCSKRLTRGGGWNQRLKSERIAQRFGYPNGGRSVSYGFRIAKSIHPSDPNTP